MSTQPRYLREVSKRFAELRGERTYDQFARDTGIAKALLQRYETGGGLPSLYVMYRLAAREKVSLNWLALGLGPRYIKN